VIFLSVHPTQLNHASNARVMWLQAILKTLEKKANVDGERKPVYVSLLMLLLLTKPDNISLLMLLLLTKPDNISLLMLLLLTKPDNISLLMLLLLMKPDNISM
jgi:hypothetical protein